MKKFEKLFIEKWKSEIKPDCPARRGHWCNAADDECRFEKCMVEFIRRLEK